MLFLIYWNEKKELLRTKQKWQVKEVFFAWQIKKCFVEYSDLKLVRGTIEIKDKGIKQKNGK